MFQFSLNIRISKRSCKDFTAVASHALRRACKLIKVYRSPFQTFRGVTDQKSLKQKNYCAMMRFLLTLFILVIAFLRVSWYFNKWKKYIWNQKFPFMKFVPKIKKISVLCYAISLKFNAFHKAIVRQKTIFRETHFA